jgi:hypothetical protein
MVMVKTMTITIDSLLLRQKLDCGVGYDVAVKGACVIVCATDFLVLLVVAAT